MQEARRTQQFFGGQLASHLLKLGFVDEAKLGEALSAVTNVPFASYDVLRAVPVEVQDAVPAELLESHRACPLGREGQVLRLAMLDPRDLVAIRAIERKTGLRVEPWVTTEYRLYQALERYYRIRFDGLRSLSLAPPAEMRRWRMSETTDGAAEGEELADEPEVGLDGLPLDAEAPEAALWSSGPGAALLDASQAAAAAELEAESARPAVDDPMERLERTLCGGPGHEEIAEAVLEYASAQAGRVAMFAVGRDAIRGIAGRGLGFGDVPAIALPAEGNTVLHDAAAAPEFHFGPLLPVPANRELFSLLGGRIPPTALVLPIRVRERTVALMYLDNASQTLSRPDIPSLRRVASKAGLAFEILILRNKLRRF